MASNRRVAALLGHLQSGEGNAAARRSEDEEAKSSQVTVNETMMGMGGGGGAGGGMNAIMGLLPLLAIGAFTMFQSRRNKQDEDVELTAIEQVAEDQGFDMKRLRELETWATSNPRKNKLPGVVLAVKRKGELVYHEAFGNRSYNRDTIVSLQSMSMPIITAAFMSLVDEGLCSADDDVTKWVPAFANFRVYRSGTTAATLETDPMGIAMKVSHILTNTWGFPGQFFHQSKRAEIRLLDGMAADVYPTIGNDEDFERLAEIPLIDQPGRQYRVGISASVMGHIITKVVASAADDHPLKGKSLPEIVQSRIFDPLGMEDTQWYVPGPKQHRLAELYEASPRLTYRLWGHRLTGQHTGHNSWLGWVGTDVRRAVPEEAPAALTEETSMYTSALDQIAFQEMLLSGGVSESGERVLSADSVAAMTTDQLLDMGADLSDTDFNSHARDKRNSAGMKSPEFGVDAAGQGVSYGMNVVTRPSTAKISGAKGTFSSWGYYGTACWSDPALEMSVFIGTQLAPFWAMPDIRTEVAGALYGSFVPTAAVKSFKGDANASGGGMGMMNMMLMMSMMGGMGGMGRM